MQVTDAFYRRAGERVFQSTVNTIGPWDARAQHGGPPSALLARALEADGAALGLPRLMRLTVELLKPVPVAELEVQTSIVKRGRSAARLEGALVVEGKPVLRASALTVREDETPLPPLPAIDEEAVPGPAQAAPFDFPFFRTEVGYHTSVETRLLRGTFGQGPTFVWTRLRVALVEGEPITPLTRVVVAADSGNGVSPVLDWKQHSFINPDLTVALYRPPEGEWVALDAETRVGPGRVGQAHTTIRDESGPLGHGIQSLLMQSY